MNSFVQRHSDSVTGMLSGFDRVRFRGTLRLLANAGGMGAFLAYMGVLLKEFKQYVQDVTEQVRQATITAARTAGRPLRFVSSPAQSKEDLARAIAQRDGIRQGLICVLSAVEVLWSYDIHRNRDNKHLELVPASRKCLHYYHYYLHATFGFMHVRLATWFPLTMHVCINGREWLGRQMDAAGIGYQRRDNCFTHIDDLPRAQELLELQLRTDWPKTLDAVAREVNPVHKKLFARCPLDYYWSGDQSEWASDVMFKSPRKLSALYPQLVAHAVHHLGSRDVMRFLGKSAGHGFKGEVISDLKQRPEGMRVKHRVNNNSIKMYDKQASVLRIETTLNDARDLKVYRPKEGDEGGKKSWRPLRKGVADLHRRAQVCQAANERYLEAMASVEEKTPLGQLARHLCRPIRWKDKSVRALNPMAPQDAMLLQAVSRGEFVLHGFRNRDLVALLFDRPTPNPQEAKRRSAQVTRKLRLLRAHGLIRKLPHTHRYLLSPKGRIILTALIAAQAADTATLAAAA